MEKIIAHIKERIIKENFKEKNPGNFFFLCLLTAFQNDTKPEEIIKIIAESASDNYKSLCDLFGKKLVDEIMATHNEIIIKNDIELLAIDDLTPVQIEELDNAIKLLNTDNC